MWLFQGGRGWRGPEEVKLERRSGEEQEGVALGAQGQLCRWRDWPGHGKLGGPGACLLTKETVFKADAGFQDSHL